MKQGLPLLAIALLAAACSDAEPDAASTTKSANAPKPRVIYFSLGRT